MSIGNTTHNNTHTKKLFLTSWTWTENN